MSDGCVVLFLKYKERPDHKTKEILDDFRKFKIRHKIVDLTEKFELYGNKVTLEGAFAMDFSENGKTKVPITPLATTGEELFNGPEEIKRNLEYLKKNYSTE